MLKSFDELIHFLFPPLRRTDTYDALLLIHGADGAKPFVGLGNTGQVGVITTVDLEK